MSERLISLAGIAFLIGIAVILSSNRRAIRPRIVISAFALQAAIAAIVLWLPLGKSGIQAISQGVQAVIDFSQAGIGMVFGSLATDNAGFSFAVQVLPVIIFFSSLMAVLYHLGVMQFIVRWVGGALQRIVGTPAVASMNAAANVFVGQTEAPLAVRPYLPKLSDAQIFVVMVSGVASVAGSVLAAYAQMGVRLDYLLAASFMAAPGGLLMANLLMPDEDDVADDNKTPIAPADEARHTNVILAAAVGAHDGLKLAVNVGAMLIAFVSLIALFNGVVGWAGGLMGVENLTLERILGFVFAPLMWLLSVPWNEAQLAGSLFGEKLILNEFVAFLHMQDVIAMMSPRTEAVVTFSLCGFANFSSIAILLGGLGTLVPEKRDLIARFGLKAVAAGSLSNLMSAALASLLVGL